MDPEALKELRSSGELSDFSVQVGKRMFRLHKVVMLAASDYFKGLLRSGMSDSTHCSIYGGSRGHLGCL